MAVNSPLMDYREDYYRGPARFYFERILRTLIDLGQLGRTEGLILDFGCGVGRLKRRLGRDNVIGYDIIPELSEVEDYRRLQPEKIVLNSVLEHISADGIERLLQEFLSMNREAELVVALPTENLLSRIAMRLAGQPHAHADHISNYREVNRLIERRYLPLRRRYVGLRMTQVTVYAARKEAASHAAS